MSHFALGLHRASIRTSGDPTARAVSLTTLILLVALVLQPIQMRAGAADPHPHALMQILLDARDGAIDHHAGEDDKRHGEDVSPDSPRVWTFDPDVPRLERAKPIGSGAMALTASLVVVWLLLGRLERFGLPQSEWRDRLLEVETPPPRVTLL